MHGARRRSRTGSAHHLTEHLRASNREVAVQREASIDALQVKIREASVEMTPREESSGWSRGRVVLMSVEPRAARVSPHP